MSDKKFIYRCSWYESKTATISHTDTYYEKVEHTEWIFQNDWFNDWKNGLIRIEYIIVDVNSIQYKLAVRNSKWNDEKVWVDLDR